MKANPSMGRIEEYGVGRGATKSRHLGITTKILINKKHPSWVFFVFSASWYNHGMPEPKRILLTEDDEFLSSLIKNRLEREHFEVKVAKDGEEILALLKVYKPDLVLMDIILPKKLGFEVLEEIQNNAKLNRAPVMILSNLGQDSDISRAKELGAVDYFIKAKVVIDDLIRRIKSFLEVEPTLTTPPTAQ